jgi:hypothetical protein
VFLVPSPDGKLVIDVTGLDASALDERVYTVIDVISGGLNGTFTSIDIVGELCAGTLEVRANHSQSSLQVLFKVDNHARHCDHTPVWWQRWWFIVAVIVVIMLIIVAVIASVIFYHRRHRPLGLAVPNKLQRHKDATERAAPVTNDLDASSREESTSSTSRSISSTLRSVSSEGQVFGQPLLDVIAASHKPPRILSIQNGLTDSRDTRSSSSSEAN